MQVEQEEEFLTNTLQKKLEKVRYVQRCYYPASIPQPLQSQDALALDLIGTILYSGGRHV